MNISSLDIVFSIAIGDTFALTKARVIPISITEFSYTLRFIEDKRLRYDRGSFF